jgi:hypothetical protein
VLPPHFPQVFEHMLVTIGFVVHCVAIILHKFSDLSEHLVKEDLGVFKLDEDELAPSHCPHVCLQSFWVIGLEHWLTIILQNLFLSAQISGLLSDFADVLVSEVELSIF